MWIIEYRILVPDEPKNSLDAVEKIMLHTRETICPENFVRWKEDDSDLTKGRG